MATITVPGASSGTIATTFTGTSNTALATSIANTLSSILASGSLSVTTVSGAGGTVPPPSLTGVNELVITSPGVVTVPGGYNYVVDASGGTEPLAVFNATNFLGGNGPIQVTSSGGSVVTGDGNDVFNMSGSYSVASGTGNNQYNLAGTGQVSLGGGLSLINIVSGADTIFAGASPGVTGLVGNAGSVFFYAGEATTNTASFITGGSAGDTIVGAANNTIIYASASPSTAGGSVRGALLVAGSGSETIYGVPSQTNDVIYGSFSGDASDLLWAGSGNDALVAGSGNESLVGGRGTDTFYVANSSLLSTIAGTTITPGKDTIFLTHPGNNLALTGFDTLYGAGPGGAAASVRTALASGSGAVTLKDGTTITFVGSTTGLNIVSS